MQKPFRTLAFLPGFLAAFAASLFAHATLEHRRRTVGRQDTSLSLAYLEMRADNLWSQEQPNGFGGFPTAARPDPRFTTQLLIANLNESRYHALQLTAKRRFARSVDFTIAYTFGETMDNNSRDSFTTFPTFLNSAANPAQAGVQGTGANFILRDPRADWGLSEFEVRHNLTFT